MSIQESGDNFIRLKKIFVNPILILVTSWGFGTFTFLTGSLVVSIIWAYLQDRKALYDKIIALKENRGYSVYRDKIKGGLFDFTEITFGNLFREMYKVNTMFIKENT